MSILAQPDLARDAQEVTVPQEEHAMLEEGEAMMTR
jgi:hypothetical protein